MKKRIAIIGLIVLSGCGATSRFVADNPEAGAQLADSADAAIAVAATVNPWALATPAIISLLGIVPLWIRQQVGEE